jgi:hypothetical protein
MQAACGRLGRRRRSRWGRGTGTPGCTGFRQVATTGAHCGAGMACTSPGRSEQATSWRLGMQLHVRHPAAPHDHRIRRIGAGRCDVSHSGTGTGRCTETTTAATSGQVPMIAPSAVTDGSNDGDARSCQVIVKPLVPLAGLRWLGARVDVRRRGHTHGGGEVGGDDLAGQRKPVRPPLADPLPPGRGERPAIGGSFPRLAHDLGEIRITIQQAGMSGLVSRSPMSSCGHISRVTRRRTS